MLSCRFCDYATKEGQPRAYKMSAEDILSSDQPIIVQDTEPVDFETWYVQRLDQRNEREMAHLAAQEEIDAEGIDF